MHRTESLAPLLHLLRLASPSLPVGAFAWSQGLEAGVELGWVDGPETFADWVGAALDHGFAQQELPLLQRLIAADDAGRRRWNRLALALRETAELREQDVQGGAALLRLATATDIAAAAAWPDDEPISQLTAYALHCAQLGIAHPEAAIGLVWSWLDNQLAAALKLGLFGQTRGQQLALALLARVPAMIARAAAVADADIGLSLPGQVLASMLHEPQYSRLFRS
ncbi:MAG: urease accessory protein UreF [Pseudomonadales bacterium]|nr:urease accessory protein UreF [Pseudomonadales bacterium]